MKLLDEIEERCKAATLDESVVTAETERAEEELCVRMAARLGPGGKMNEGQENMAVVYSKAFERGIRRGLELHHATAADIPRLAVLLLRCVPILYRLGHGHHLTKEDEINARVILRELGES